MPGEHHTRILFRSAAAYVADNRCRPRGRHRGGEERSGGSSVVFPRAGMFVRHVAGQDVIADANRVLFFNHHEPYHVSHPTGSGDDCTVLSIPNAALADVIRPFDPGSADRGQARFPFSDAPSETGAFREQASLVAALRKSSPEPLEVEERVSTLIARAVAAAFSVRGVRPRRQRGDTFAAHRALVFDARNFLHRHAYTAFTLGDAAGAVHCSTFHLARLFRRHTGLSIHRYVLRLRLRESLQRLADGAEDLTALALQLGFASHAHFTDAFRREFGSPPSQLRSALTDAALQQMSKIAEA